MHEVNEPFLSHVIQKYCTGHLTRLKHVRKELKQHFQNEKKPENRWELVMKQAERKQVGHSASYT